MQVAALLEKSFKLRLRDPVATLLLLTAPTFFILLLSFGWWYSTSPMADAAMYNDTYLFNLTASDEDGSLGSVFCQSENSKAGRPPLFLPLCPDSSQMMEDGGFCLNFLPATTTNTSTICVFNVSLGGSLSYSFQSPAAPAVVPNLDTYLLYLAFTTATGASTNFMSRCPGSSLSHAGYLILVGDNNMTQRFRHFCQSHSALCGEILFPFTFSVMEEAAAFAHDNGGAVWAILDLTNIDLNGRKTAEYSIRLNYTATPWTFDVEVPFSQGVDQNYLLYLSSGFLTLQTFVNSFILAQILQTNISTAALNFEENISDYISFRDRVACEPFPTRSFFANTFLVSWSYFLPLILMLASLVSLGVLLNSIVEEKALRLRETMTIMSLRHTSLYISWYVLANVMDTISSMGASLVLKYSFFGNVHWGVLFLLTWSFMQTISSLGMLLSVFFGKPKVAAVVGPLIVFVSSVPFYAIPHGTSKSALMWLSLLPSTAYAEAVNIMTAYATFGYEITINDLTTASASGSSGGGDPYTLATSLKMMWISVGLYLLLAAYLDQVVPHEFGQRRQSIFFPLYRLLELVGKSNGELVKEGAAALAVENVSKNYNEPSVCFPCARYYGECEVVSALKHVSMELHRGELSVLLGSNGAGKTTLINLIVGMLPVIEGRILIDGVDQEMSPKTDRRQIGYCPQYNVLWPSLTVEEHLIFYAKMKSLNWDVGDRVNQMLKVVHLETKRNCQAHALSAGQKRRLCVAVALIGDPLLVLLDEPTAMMDIRCRRELYSCLLLLRPSRAILLSTHQLSEADSIGDTMNILKDGKLVASGTSLQLKHQQEQGYVLSVILRDNQQAAAEKVKKLMETVLQPVAMANTLGMVVRGREIELRLSASIFSSTESSSSVGNELFTALEERQEELGIHSFGLSTISLEDVFLAISGAPVMSSAGPTGEEGMTTPLLSQEYKFDAQRFRRHFYAMLSKRWNCAKRDRRAVVFHIFLPVLFLCFALLVELIKPPDQPPLVLDAAMYANGRSSLPLPNEVLLSQWDKAVFFHNYSRLAGLLNDEHGGDTLYVGGPGEVYCDEANGCDFPLDEALSEQLLNHRLTRTVALAVTGEYGGAMKRRASMVLHNASYPHSLAEGVTLLYNIMYRELLRTGNTTSRMPSGIRTVNHPLPMSRHENQMIGLFRRVISGIFVLIPFTFIPSSFVSFIVQEKESGARHLQTMAGVNVAAFWLASGLFDLASFLMTELLAFVAFLAFDRREYVGDWTLGMATFSLLFLYGLSSIPFTYALSFMFRTHGTAQNVVLCLNFLVGFLLVIAEQVLSGYSSTLQPSLDAAHFLRVIPVYSLGEGLFTIAGRRLSLLLAPPGSSPQPSVFSFLVYSDTNGGFMGGIGTSLLYMGLMVVAASVCLIGLEVWRFARTYEPLSIGDTSTEETHNETGHLCKERDISVIAEEDRVRDTRTRSLESINSPFNDLGDDSEGILLQNVTRRFNCGTTAVSDVSLCVSRGETMALLGLNGAGKSTILGILAGQQEPSSGTAFVGGSSTMDPRSRMHVGYCPQADAHLPYMTASEHLELYCRLRGIPEKILAREVTQLLIDFGLESEQNVPAAELSFGNRRKLSVAVAFAGPKRVVLLDEPTAGMDPSARRQTCDAIRRRCAAMHLALLLTTHQLDEVDALADRVAILADGCLRAVGRRQELKSRFTKGAYSVQLLLHTDTPELLQRPQTMAEIVLPTALKECGGRGKWTAKMTSERMCVLTALEAPLSAICRAASAIQHQFRDGKGLQGFVVEDLSVSQHSMEEVLLSLSLEKDREDS
jgi:ATP-binding cassette subfamily A (ABC1) protein 3